MNVNKQIRTRSRWLSATVLALTATTLVSAMGSQVNVYNVTDSRETVQLRTLSDNPARIAEMAGFQNEEYLLLSNASSGGLHTLTVAKRLPIHVLADGKIHKVEGFEGTVAEVLAYNGITVGAQDEVSPAQDTILGETEAAQEISITRVRTEMITERLPIAYEVQKKNNSDIPYGTTRVTQKGADGVVEREILVTYRDGEETSRQMQSETVAVAPTAEIVQVGTGGAVVTRGGDALRYSRVLDVKATAYSTEGWSHENKFTKIGTRCRVGAIAVDPKVIPLGSKLYITSADGQSWIYGTAVAEDTGGAIKGNRIDLYYNTQAECERFGVRAAKVYVLD